VSPRPLVFVSAVSRELRNARQLVANTLIFLGYEPVWQEVFGTEGGDLRQVLREKIDECDGVVQLVGKCYGIEAPTPDETYGRVSYTQFEAVYARDSGKKVWYLFIDEHFPADPCDPEPEELRKLQADYRRRLQTDAHLFHPLTTREALEASVLKLRNDLTRLRRGVKRWAAAVAILLVLSVALGFWLARGQRKTAREVGETRQALAAMTEELSKLRKGIAEYPAADAKARNARAGDDQGAIQEKVYAELGKQLGIEPKLLREKLPQFAQQLKRAPDATGYERANAAFVAKDYREAERLALQAADENVNRPSPKLQEAIRAFELASWSAQRAIRYHDALNHLRRAEQLTSQARDPREWATVQDEIARVLLRQGHYGQAENIWREVVATRVDALGARNSETLRSRIGLAVAMHEQGKYAEAEKENREIIQLQEKAAGADDPATLAARNNLAEVIHKQGKLEEAEAEYRAVIEKEMKVLGPENPDTLKTRNNLSVLLTRLGKFEEAENECREVIKLKTRVLGSEHPDTLASRTNLANALSAQGHYEQAEPEYREVIRLEEKLLGPEHPNTLMGRHNLALVLGRQNKPVEAEAEFRAVAQLEEKILGPEHPDTLRSRMGLALSLSRQGKVAEARGIAMRDIEAVRRVLGPENPLTQLAEKLSGEKKQKKK
jgi:tetratricopeptide (TPR) repeat protein